MTTNEKLTFLKYELPVLLSTLTGDEKPQWGIMSPQQMVEHMGGAFLNGAGLLVIPLATPADQLPAYKSFMMSDKEFRPNTKNPTLSESGYPLKFADMPTAIQKLKNAIEAFEKHFTDNPQKTELHAIFGNLNFDEWVHLMYKHARHHLRQFMLIE